MLWDLFFTFLKIGAFSFGGGYAMLPLIRQEVTISHQWLTETQFVDMLAISEMTPGPIAVNTATFVGHSQAGVLGGAIATLGVILPSFVIVSLMFFFISKFRENKLVDLFFRGLRVVVIGLIAAGFLSVLQDMIVDVRAFLIAIFIFWIVAFKRVHPVLAILIAAGLGLILYGGLDALAII